MVAQWRKGSVSIELRARPLYPDYMSCPFGDTPCKVVGHNPRQKGHTGRREEFRISFFGLDGSHP